jgi:radical SAM superfamily enzyme YgiQ (UPF0313 family)
MRPKIVLYNPQAVFYTMPLALLAVGSYLDREQYDVMIIDGRLEADPVQAVLAQLDGALCLGVSVLTGQPIRDALRISRAAKAARPDLPIIWGGWHPSLFPRETLAEPSVDVVVMAQGEETFGEIVARLRAGERSMQGVAGCAFRRGRDGEVVINPPRLLRDVNDLPPHDYTLIPVERYFTLKRGKRQLDYISSQGCRFRCTFCADPYVYNRGWVGLAPERMGAEIEALARRYGVHEVAFQDETFFTNRARVEAIADEFIRRGLDVAWTGTLRADQGQRLDDRVLAKCHRSGLRRVMIGVESGSQEMLDRIKKDITLEQVWETAEKCIRHRIGVIYNIIVGFPGEPDDSVAESLNVAKRLRAMSPNFEVAIFFYKPYPGNPIADELLQQGYRFPQTLEEWAAFDYIAGRSEWVSEEKWRLVESFKFYQRLAWGHNHNPLRWPFSLTARWRCRRDFYLFPVEKALLERLRPAARLS